jgi:hypothetical protein
LPALDESNGLIRGKRERSLHFSKRADYELTKFLVQIREL